MQKFDPLKISRDLDLCAPYFKRLVEKSLAECNALGYQVRVFEGYRTPERQTWLYDQGRHREGKIVTQAKAWESYHQLGVACDLAFFINGKWSWDSGPWDKIGAVFKQHGLDSLAPYEQAHFQLTGGMPIRDAHAITIRSGVQSLWQKLSQ